MVQCKKIFGVIKLKQFIVDAFTDRLFAGNQAAVCPVEEFPCDGLMMRIARENNFSETAFALKSGDKYILRWFTPTGEIDLCGHATLATAYVILEHVDINLASVEFETLSGRLTVHKRGELFEMNFPAYEYRTVPVTEEMTAALGVRPIEAVLSRDLLMVLEREEDVKKLAPDLGKLMRLDGVIQAVTARGTDFDCVSRVFAPKLGIDEDPVTGSTHCLIAPYWSRRLGKKELRAFQASERTGVMNCVVEGARVKLLGNAVLYSISELMLPHQKTVEPRG